MPKKKPKPDGITVTTPGIQFAPDAEYISLSVLIETLANWTRKSQPLAKGVLLWFDGRLPAAHRDLRSHANRVGLVTVGLAGVQASIKH